MHRSATFYTLVPCFHAFNPSAAKGEVTRLSYRVELKGTRNPWRTELLRRIAKVWQEEGMQILYAFINGPLYSNVKGSFKRNLLVDVHFHMLKQLGISYYLEIVNKILWVPFL